MKTIRNLIYTIIAAIFIFNGAAVNSFAIDLREVLPDGTPTAAPTETLPPEVSDAVPTPSPDVSPSADASETPEPTRRLYAEYLGMTQIFPGDTPKPT
ncbi:MAG: hypothetical protein RR162_09110, partial [Oscillospiraceae bacterium]